MKKLLLNLILLFAGTHIHAMDKQKSGIASICAAAALQDGIAHRHEAYHTFIDPLNHEVLQNLKKSSSKVILNFFKIKTMKITCPVCREELICKEGEVRILFSCNHIFCQNCHEKIKENKDMRCSLCRNEDIRFYKLYSFVAECLRQAYEREEETPALTS
ncbi:hypothetical protein K9K77_01405 [Candidatus Babeliales bacterium]|nr:hypothetical protein [Candidatus Babeliales bacterium]